MSTWTKKECQRCLGKKGQNQKHEKYCYRCKIEVRRERSRGAHARSIFAKYGITAEQYNALYEFQGGRCYLCRHSRGKSKRLTVDHDHACCPDLPACGRCVRGLLCANCNHHVLGWAARDSIEFFERGISYLKNPPFKCILEGRKGIDL
jgi:hypothetical protein